MPDLGNRGLDDFFNGNFHEASLLDVVFIAVSRLAVEEWQYGWDQLRRDRTFRSA